MWKRFSLYYSIFETGIQLVKIKNLDRVLYKIKMYLYFLKKHEQKNVEQNTNSEFSNYSVKCYIKIQGGKRVNYAKIKQVKETKSVNEVNVLLKGGWVLLGTSTGGDFIFILGKVDTKLQNPETKDIKTPYDPIEAIKARNKRFKDIRKLEEEIVDKRNKLINIGNGIFVKII